MNAIKGLGIYFLGQFEILNGKVIKSKSKLYQTQRHNGSLKTYKNIRYNQRTFS